jgi:hypothetical protein
MIMTLNLLRFDLNLNLELKLVAPLLVLEMEMDLLSQLKLIETPNIQCMEGMSWVYFP